MELFDNKDYAATIEHFFDVAASCGKAKPASPDHSGKRISDLHDVHPTSDCAEL